VIRIPEHIQNYRRVPEAVYTHLACFQAQHMYGSTQIQAFLRAAEVTVTPPGLSEGGQTFKCIWSIPRAFIPSSVIVEVWLCDAECHGDCIVLDLVELHD